MVQCRMAAASVASPLTATENIRRHSITRRTTTRGTRTIPQVLTTTGANMTPYLVVTEMGGLLMVRQMLMTVLTST